jgi:hypothetical protein
MSLNHVTIVNSLKSVLSIYVITIRVITKLPNSEQSHKGKVKAHKYINRQNQSTTGKQYVSFLSWKHQLSDRHISTFRGYRILFSIINPYINRFANHFSIHSKPSYPQKVVLHSITAQFCLRSYYSVEYA